MTELIWICAALAAGAAGTEYFRRQAAAHRRRAYRNAEHAEGLEQQLRAAEQFVQVVAATTAPATAAPGHRGAPRPELPAPLTGTPLAAALDHLTAQTAAAVTLTEQRAQATVQEYLTQVRAESEKLVGEARQESVDVARAAVRSFASSTVQRATKLSSSISAGVRRHVSDEAYATLVEIDHLAQQMLLTASGYAVLAGDKLSRRWPATTLTDVVRTAMGRVEGYQRVQHPEMDALAVDSRAVEAVVHSLAVLLDNALRYSPPNARVHITLEHGANAAFLVVDDAGLRIEDERLARAREVLSGQQVDDITRLGAYPQTGLRVAAALAAQYGFRVDLAAPNMYGGTRAVIVLPQGLLTPAAPARAADPAPPRVPAAVPVEVPRPAPVRAVPSPAPDPQPEREPEPMPTPMPEPASEPAPEPAEPATTANGLTVRRRARRQPAGGGRVRAVPDPVEPGSPGIAAAWLEGSRRVPQQDRPSTDGGQ